MGYEIIEFYTSVPEWMVSWWMIALVIALVALTIGFFTWGAVNDYRDRAPWIFGAIVFPIILVGLYVSMCVMFGDRNLTDAEVDRVSVEVSEATGVEVGTSEVEDMMNGNYVPGVNYVKMTDVNGKDYFKVEVE